VQIPAKILPRLNLLVHTAHWEILNELIQYLKDMKVKEITKLSDIQDIYKVQGYLQLLNELQNLRESVQYQLPKKKDK
jgi:hypothetical protein